MNDAAIIRLCADAMDGSWPPPHYTHSGHFDPLHDDAQALALVERFRMLVRWDGGVHGWTAGVWYDGSKGQAIWMDWTDQDLRRAICLCVAKMQWSKEAP